MTSVESADGPGPRPGAGVRLAIAAVSAAVVAVLLGCGTDPPRATGQESTAAGPASTEVSSTAGVPPNIAASAAGLWLREDGLGLIAFGEPDWSAMERLIEAMGQPRGDTTWTGDMPDGIGGRDTTVRLVEFDPLIVTFTDWPIFRDDGVMHFVRWTLLEGSGSSRLATLEAISVGSTVDQLRSAYGDRLVLSEGPDECSGSWLFSVGGSALGLQGTLAGPPTDGSSIVVALTAGAQSSC